MFKFIQILALAASTAQALKVSGSDDNSHSIDYNALFPGYHPQEYEDKWDRWDYKDHEEEEEAE